MREEEQPNRKWVGAEMGTIHCGKKEKHKRTYEMSCAGCQVGCMAHWILQQVTKGLKIPSNISVLVRRIFFFFFLPISFSFLSY